LKELRVAYKSIDFATPESHPVTPSRFNTAKAALASPIPKLKWLAGHYFELRRGTVLPISQAS
jgi:hypothetical protein